MNFLKKSKPTNPTLLLGISLLVLSACSSQQQVVSVSEAHLYDNNFGIVQDSYANAMLNAERIAMQSSQVIEDNNREFPPAPGTFYAEDYVQAPEVITYKYQFDPKFYSNAEWRKFP